MATEIRIDLNLAGIREAALTSQNVRDMVAKFSEQVADRARADGDTIETFHGGHDRARSYVRLAETNSAANEARNRILGRALGRM
jgi:hypothetical protein